MLSAFGKIERDMATATAAAGSRTFPIVRPAALDAPAPEAVSRTNFGIVPSVILHGAALALLLMEMTGGQPVEAPQMTMVALVAPVAETISGEVAAAIPIIKSFTPMPHPPAYQPPEPALAAAEPEAVAIEKPKEKKQSAAKARPAKSEKRPQPVTPPQPTATPQTDAAEGTAESQAAVVHTATQGLTATTAPATTTMASAVNSGVAAALADTPVLITDPGYAGACPIDYPARAQRRNQQGTVVIRALIGADGRPTEVLVKSSSGFRLLDDAARDAIADCAFKPQTVGGRPVKAIVEIPIPFKLI